MSEERSLLDQFVAEAEREQTTNPPPASTTPPAPQAPSADAPAVDLVTAGPSLQPVAASQQATLVRLIQQIESTGIWGSPLRRTRRPEIFGIWVTLEQSVQKSDIWQQLSSDPAPDWLKETVRDAFRSIPGLPAPRAKHDVILNRANPAAIIEAMVIHRPNDVLNLIEQAASRRGYSVVLDEARVVGEKLLAHSAQADRLKEWAADAGIQHGGLERAVVDALAVYPKTSAWMGELADCFDDAKHRRNITATNDDAALRLAVVAQNEEVFQAVPAALRYQRAQFLGDGSKSVDYVFPTRLLFHLRAFDSSATTDPNHDFHPYLAVTPGTHFDRAEKPENKAARDRFYRNFGYLVLGGLDRDVEKDGHARTLQHLFRNLIEKDIVPEAGAGESVLERFQHLKMSIEDRLLRMPAQVGHGYRFLIGAKSEDAKLRMTGMYFAGTPFRNQLLGTGPLSVLRDENCTGPLFRELVAGAYTDKQLSTVRAIPFQGTDKARASELVAIASLNDEQGLKRLVPILVWLHQEATAAAQYDAGRAVEVKAAGIERRAELKAQEGGMAAQLAKAGAAPADDVANTVAAVEMQNIRNEIQRIEEADSDPAVADRADFETLKALPAAIAVRSLAADGYGWFFSGEHPAAFERDGLNAPRFLSLLLSAATALAIDAPEKAGRAASEPWMSDAEIAQRSLEDLADRWDRSPTHWKELTQIVSGSSALNAPLDAEFHDRVAAKVREATGEERTWSPLSFTRDDRLKLDDLLKLPLAPRLLRGRAELRDVDRLLGAAMILQDKPLEPAHFWQQECARFVEHVKLSGSVDVAPPPERGADGRYERPKRSVRVTTEDLTGARIEEIARNVLRLKGDEPTPAPRPPTASRAWFSPAAWRNAYEMVQHHSREVAMVFGGGTLTDLPRLLEFTTAVRPELAPVLGAGAKVASALLVSSDKKPEIGTLGEQFGRLLSEWRAQPQITVTMTGRAPIGIPQLEKASDQDPRLAPSVAPAISPSMT